MTQITLVDDTAKLDEVITSSGLQIEEANQVKENYLPFLSELHTIKEQSSKINFDTPTEIDEKIARELRLKVVKIRTNAGSVKGARKKIHLLKGNLEQAAYNLIKADCELIEEAFTQVEKAREIAEKKRRAELKEQRTKLLADYSEVVSIDFVDLGSMSDEDFTKFFDGAKLLLQSKREAEAKAEAERLAAIEAERKRQEAIEAENARLKAEAEAKEKELEAERKKAADEAEKIRLENEKRLAKERAEAEAKLKAEQEKARIEKEKADAERAKLEAELKAKKDAEEAERKRIEAEAKAKADAEAKLAKAGDKKRLLSWINSFEVATPNTEGMKPEAAQLTQEIQQKFAGFLNWANDKINAL